MKATPIILAALALPALALAHPHDTPEPEDAPEAESRWPFFGSDAKDDAKTERRAIIRLQRDGEAEEDVEVFRWEGKELKDAARDMEDALRDTEVFSDMAELLAEFAANVEVRKGDETGTALMFDGAEMLRFKMDRDSTRDEALSITGLGRNLTVERETIVEDGRSRTRIVIEMDGGEDLDIELPERDAPRLEGGRKGWLDQE